MSRVPYSVLMFVLALLLLTSCETAKSIKSSITSKMKSFTSSVDDEVFSQVPAGNRQEVRKAQYDLKVAEEKVKLVGLKMDLAALQKKHASYEEDLADKYHEKAVVSVDLAKLEAIDKSGLGQKEDNIKTIANLQAKKLEIEADMVKIEGNLTTTESQIKDLNKQIAEQAEKVDGMQMSEMVEEVETDSPTIAEEEQKAEPTEETEDMETPEEQEGAATESPSVGEKD